MIILKILLYVLLAVLGIALVVIILALALPAVVKVSFIGGKLDYKVKFSFIPLMSSDGGGLLSWLKKRRKKKTKVPDEDDFFDDEITDSVDVDEDDGGTENIPIDEEDNTENNDATEEKDENAERTEKIKKIRDRKHHKESYDDNDEYYVFDDDDDNEKDGEKGEKSLMDKIDFLLDVWDCGGRPILKVFKGVHINDIFIDFIVADEDAFKCAVNYGMVSGTVWNGLAWLGEACTVSYKTVDVRCGFSLKESQWDASCCVKFRLHTLVTAGVWFLVTYIFKIFLPEKMKKKTKKSAERQK